MRVHNRTQKKATTNKSKLEGFGAVPKNGFLEGLPNFYFKYAPFLSLHGRAQGSGTEW